ncbi:flagellar filament capping protein FliD [Mucisphaera sp.]|uniref:flagellar filament capping protein FliD n=1 Tax=Mucisphaera sp. TaxID=2913024 RepID=UPI003D0E5FE2
MGQITSSVGLISGIDTGSLIDQLIDIQTGPRRQLEQRNAVLQAQQVAFQDINARLLNFKLNASSLSRSTIFRNTTGSSSNESVATVSTTAGAAQGSYSFTVSRLVRSQQTITEGFRDADQTPLQGGTISFDRAESRLTTSTRLSVLNGGEGVQRGTLTLTDRAGRTADIDLSTAVQLEDVVEAINSTTSIGVRASIEGDGLTLTDISGGAGTLSALESDTAASLGLSTAGGVDDSTVGVLVSSRLNELGGGTSLSDINDGNGVRVSNGGPDLVITARDGSSFNVVLEEAQTLDDVIDAINSASGGSVTARISNGGVRDGSSLTLEDNTGGGGNLTIANGSGSQAATDLGLVADVASDELVGGRILAELGSKLVKNLRGGQGLSVGDTLEVTNSLGSTASFSLAGAESITDLVEQFNAGAAGIGVVASINNTGNGISLRDHSGGSGSLTVATIDGGTLSEELGIDGSFSTGRTDGTNLQLRYLSEATRLDKLGITRGQFTITDALGDSAVVDLTQGNEETLADVIGEINSKGLNINARINDTGDGILLEDTTPDGTAAIQAITVEERGSSTAGDLGILGSAADPGADLDGSFETRISFSSESLTLGTDVSTLNDGEGLGSVAGQNDLRITLKDGTEIELDYSDVDASFDGDASTTSLRDVIEFIEAGVEAVTGNRDVTIAINDAETGLVVTDGTGGLGAFRIEGINDSTLAEDLGIEGSTDPALNEINGETIVDVTTLQDLSTRINDAGAPAIATIINDGNPNGGFRLNMTARGPGEAGAFVFDDGGLGFNARTLTEAQDAAVFLGDSKDLLITSSTNSLDSLIPGASISLTGVSDNPVTISINEDLGQVTTTIESFVTSFNDVISTIDQYDAFDAETETRGLLLGDSTVAQIRSRLFNSVTSASSELSGTFRTLSQVGIRIEAGGVLGFDAERFNEALERDRQGVINLFTQRRTETVEGEFGAEDETNVIAVGIMAEVDDLLANLTDSFDGTIKRRDDLFNEQVENNNDRIAQLNENLDRERAKLEAEFIAMERALAQLQGQSSALAQIQQIAPLSFGN